MWLDGVNVDGLPVTSPQLGQRVTYAGGAAFSSESQDECKSDMFAMFVGYADGLPVISDHATDTP